MNDRRPPGLEAFENGLLEKFSRIHPITPFVVYLPVIATVIYRSSSRHDIGILPALGVVVAGLFVWTLAEYGLHRSIFHWTKDTAFGRRFHFLAHGVHHDYPNEAIADFPTHARPRLERCAWRGGEDRSGARAASSS